jgi:hypothetical protein
MLKRSHTHSINRYNRFMRTTRPASMIIKFLVALLVVLLVGFVPLRDLLYPKPEFEIAEVPLVSPRVVTPTATILAAASVPETPAPTPLGPLVEIPNPIWAANRADNTILRIDPDQNQVTGRVVLEGKLGPVTTGVGGVWAVVSSGRSQVNIIRLNSDDLSIAATIPIYSGQVTCLQVGAGSVWVGVDHSAVDPAGGGSILRIDPQSNEINAVIPRSGIPVEFASYAHTLWVLENQDQTNSIGRVDITSLQVDTFSEIEPEPLIAPGFDHLSLGAAGIWATGGTTLYQLDPSTGDVLGAVELGAAGEGRVAALEAGDVNILVWLSNGELIQVDPFDHHIVNRFAVKPGAGRIHLRPWSVWIENDSEAEIYRIDPQPSRVSAVLSTGAKPEPTPVPTITQLSGTEPVCEAKYPTRLVKGGKAVVNLEPPVPNRLRSEPDARAEITGQIEPGEIINLIDGPVCANGWVWWYVQSRRSGMMGWTSEGDRNNYWLSPSE